ncbi:MAG: hypothetical protein QOJ25_2462 [Solirubrobacteraceae bacterium]|nr:hypothetical protein [Solirubrobacteraceae bacterium]
MAGRDRPGRGATPRLKVRSHEPVRALKRALSLRVTRLEDHPPDLELTTERCERRGRTTTRRDRGLAVPNQLLRQRTQPAEVPSETPQDVWRFLAEDQRAGDRARPTHLTRHHPPTAPLTMTNRDLLPGLPQIALDQLARPVDRPLERPCCEKPRADLPNEVVEDRLPTLIAHLRRELPKPLRRDPRLGRELLTDPAAKRIYLRPARRP